MMPTTDEQRALTVILDAVEAAWEKQGRPSTCGTFTAAGWKTNVEDEPPHLLTLQELNVTLTAHGLRPLEDKGELESLLMSGAAGKAPRGQQELLEEIMLYFVDHAILD